MTGKKSSGLILAIAANLIGVFGVSTVLAQDSAKWQATLQEAATARRDGKMEDVEKLLKSALELAEPFGPTDQHLALSLDALGTFYYSNGKFAEAQPLFVRLAELRERTLGPHHPLVAIELNNTAVIEALAGKGAEAEAHSERAIQISEETASGFSGITALATGGNHTCALGGGGQVYCWGSNLGGQLGLPSPAITAYPAAVPGVTNAAAIAAGRDFTCALLGDHTVTCWGANASGETGAAPGLAFGPSPVTGIVAAQAIAAGTEHACALLEGGTVKCWGNNQQGQLGNATGANSSAPVAIVGITGAKSIAAGDNHSCVAVGGDVLCWGSFLAASGPIVAPFRVQGLSGTIQSLGTGSNYGCALLSGGTVSCWWSSKKPATSTGTPTSPLTNAEVVQGTGEVRSLAAGYAHTCALLVDGSARCWGNNQEGQLGSGTAQNSNAPVAVRKLPPATALAAGLAHTCAVLADKTAQCWGSDSYGAPSGTIYSVRSRQPVTVGRDESTLLASIRNLADIYSGLGKFDKAEPLYQRALQLLEKAQSPEDQNKAAVLNVYAKMLRAAGRPEEASKMEERAQSLLFKPVLTDVPTQPPPAPR